MSVVERLELLNDAAKITSKNRNSQYGEPEDNFRHIAEAWTWYLRNKYGIPIDLQPYEVAIMMDLMKTARLIHDPSNRDSWLDKAGYTACGWGCVKSVPESSPAQVNVTDTITKVITYHPEVFTDFNIHVNPPVEDVVNSAETDHSTGGNRGKLHFLWRDGIRGNHLCQATWIHRRPRVTSHKHLVDCKSCLKIMDVQGI